MTRNKVINEMSKCASSVFSAQLGSATPGAHRVYVYPYKKGGGFLWALWGGKLNYDCIDDSIKDGGQVCDLEDAVMISVGRLLAIQADADEHPM